MVLNVQSMNNKGSHFMSLLMDEDVKLAFITETWLMDETNTITAIIKESGYDIIHDFRQGKLGGGTAFVFQQGYKVSRALVSCTVTTFEFTCVLLKQDGALPMLAVCIYRPGSQALSKLFLADLDKLLSDIASKYDSIVLCGDFNVHFERASDKLVCECIDILQSYGFNHHVDKPTHKLGGSIDQVASMNVSVSSMDIQPHNCIGSHHYPIMFDVCLNLSHKFKKTITFRKLKHLEGSHFTPELTDSIINFSLSHKSFADCVNELTHTCHSLLDAYAPVVTKEVSIVSSAPWFDSDYKLLRCKRRKAEKKWIKSLKKNENSNQTMVFRQEYEDIRQNCSDLATEKKKHYFTDMIKRSNNKPKTLFEMVNKAMDRNQSSPLPDLGKEIPDIQSLANCFNEYFIEKIDKIRDTTEPGGFIPTSESLQDIKCLDSFRPTTLEEIEEIVTESGILASSSDILPTSVLQENFGHLKPLIVKLVNLSLETGNCEGVKIADIVPGLKNMFLDHNVLKNYRPISNLTFLGKLIERVVLRRLNDHLKENNLEIAAQSAYKKNSSTETLLVRITNDLLIASDNRCATVVMLLDLSAAFDTVDHSLLLQILEKELSIKGTALTWFRSFLTGRSQRIRLGHVLSEDIIIKFGVPQGSVLGPVLFNIYIRSVYAFIRKYNFSVFGYADDHQVFKTFKHTQQCDVLTNQLTVCFKSIQRWMQTFYLQLNSAKTEIIIIGPPSVLKHIQIGGVMLTSNTCVRFVPTVKSLGMLLDSNLSYSDQVKALKKKSFLTLRNIRKIRHLLSEDQRKTVMNSLVVSCLDYCNAMYLGINKRELNQLQIIQNTAAKCVSGKFKFDHVGSDLTDLHWLSVNKRIVFKVALLVYKSLSGVAPSYLRELLTFASAGRRCDLYVPAVNTLYGKRAFSTAAPKLWNHLPKYVTQSGNVADFKKNMKTFMFTLNENDVNRLYNS